MPQKKKEDMHMAYCKNCGAQIPDDAVFCGNCGASVNPQPETQPYVPPVYVDPNDHTSEFDPADISENKVTAMAAYILGMVGIIIALLAAPNSKYAAFHSRQALKLEIVDVLLVLISAVLAFTVVVPIAGGVCLLILLVVRIICFFNVCSGKAKEAPIISSLGFLK